MTLVQAPHLPELPRVYVDTDYENPTGNTLPVTNSSELHAALASSQPGDIISVALGNYPGAFVLPSKSGSSYIYVVSASLSSLPPPGTRIGPADIGFMPKIIGLGSNQTAIATSGPAHNFRFVGIQVQCPTADANNGLVRLGTGSETNDVQFPEYLILDRCIVRGDPTSGGTRGVLIAGNHIGLVDSYIYDWKRTDAQCQAAAMWTGRGPLSIKNCYLEADAENFMAGGSDPAITDLVPSDIEFINNLCSKPLTWNPFHVSFAGTYWNVANLFELKSARRVLCIENTFTNNWRSVQAGRAILFTTKNQFGTATWTVVEDVSFLNNVISGSHSGVAISGNDGGEFEDPPRPSMGGQRIRIHNNFFHDIGGDDWGEDADHVSSVFALTGGMQHVTIQHNTIIRTVPSAGDGLLIQADGDPYQDFRFVDNIVDHNTYGVKGPSLGIGNATLSVYFPAAIFEKNVIYNAGGNSGNYPANNYFPATKADVGFRNPSSDYRLDPTTTVLSDLITGLMAFFDLSDAQDSIGTNHLSETGGPLTYSSDGVDLESGSAQSLFIADNAAMSTGDVNWSFNIWVQSESLDGGQPHGGFPFIACKGWQATQDANSEWGIVQNGAGQPLVFAIASGTTVVSVTGSVLTNGALQMVTVGHDAGNNLIWISLNAGTKVTASTAGVAPNNGNRAFVLGARIDATPLAWDGFLRRAAFYKGVVLSDQQIDDLYNLGVPLSLAQMQAGEVTVCPYADVASDGGPIGAPDSVIETLP